MPSVDALDRISNRQKDTLDNTLESASGTSLATARRSPASLLLMIGIAGLLTVFAWATWDQWIPLRACEVVRVIAQRPQQAEGASDVISKKTTNAAIQAQASAQISAISELRFQAAGWLEADPFTIDVSALVSGIVDSVAVVDGQAVKAGDEIARLDTGDFEFALRRQHALHAEYTAKLLSADARILLAQTHVTAHNAHHLAAEAVVAERRDDTERMAAAQSAIGDAQLRRSQLRLATAIAEVAAVHSGLSLLEVELIAARAQRGIILGQLQGAIALRDKAQLDLERCSIRAPIDGCIQKLYARPGGKQMLRSDDENSVTVATMYDPQKLQVRVDVALDDSAGLFIGQMATVTCNALPGHTFQAAVTRILGHADVARNTLQAKVRIENPHQLLRPDMLVKVRFYGSPQGANSEDTVMTAGSQSAHGRLQCFLPAIAMTTTEGAATVWVVDGEQRVQQRQIEIAGRIDGYIRIRSGLLPGEWVLRKPPAGLVEGERIRVVSVAHTTQTQGNHQ